MFAAVGAGLVSALLGVGGGIVKVPVMNLAMGVPLKVATATSNMMIGITATSSAVIYLLRDEINPYIAGPTALGVFVGASIGSRIADRIDVRILRWLFVIVVLYTAFEMARARAGPRMSGDDARRGRTAPARPRPAIETLVARILVVGTYVAIGLILVGVVLMLASGVDPLAPGRVPAVRPREHPGRHRGPANPNGFLWAGIVLVMALPIGRVVVAGAGFFAAGTGGSRSSRRSWSSS